MIPNTWGSYDKDIPLVGDLQVNTGTCPCCGRHVGLTLHHLIPKKMHRRPRFKKRVSRSDLQQGVYICRQCHNGIHRFYDEMYLATHLNNLGALLADERLSRYFYWVSKQKINSGG